MYIQIPPGGMDSFLSICRFEFATTLLTEYKYIMGHRQYQVVSVLLIVPSTTASYVTCTCTDYTTSNPYGLQNLHTYIIHTHSISAM